MKENAGERAAKYLDMTSRALASLKPMRSPEPIDPSKLDYVLMLANDYTRDAKHYLSHRKEVTALACVAYAEGLIDALKFLHLADL